MEVGGVCDFELENVSISSCKDSFITTKGSGGVRTDKES